MTSKSECRFIQNAFRTEKAISVPKFIEKAKKLSVVLFWKFYQQETDN